MKNILIVEDDRAIAKIYQIELESKGFGVTIASNGEEGLEKAKTVKPDLILLDIMMPKMNGVDVLRQLQNDEATKKIPSVMLTNFGQESLVKEAFNLGALDYVLKYQITPQELVIRIDQLLNKSNNEQWQPVG